METNTNPNNKNDVVIDTNNQIQEEVEYDVFDENNKTPVEQLEDELEKLDKSKQKKRKRKKQKSPLKDISKRKKKQRRRERTPLIAFLTTLLLMLIALFIYSVPYLLSPTYTFTADITVVRGGYQLQYDMCEVPLRILDEDIEVGDEKYFTQYGLPSNTSKDSVLMKVVKIEDGTAYLEFVAEGIPTFISTAEMKEIIKKFENGKQYSTVCVVGKIVANRFTLIKIHT